MSFILDALRKSESERRRDVAPGLAHIPPAAPRSHTPPWVWIVIGVLTVGILGLTVAWWQSAQTKPQIDGDASRAAAEQARAPAAATAGGAESPTSPASDEAAPGRRDPVPAEGRTAQENLPSVADVVADGLALPPLELQLISYSEDESRRFVFINGFQYRQGERVQNGPLVVSITPESVLLRQQGRDFVLTPQ
jgi:hypothetical protein